MPIGVAAVSHWLRVDQGDIDFDVGPHGSSKSECAEETEALDAQKSSTSVPGTRLFFPTAYQLACITRREIRLPSHWATCTSRIRIRTMTPTTNQSNR